MSHHSKADTCPRCEESVGCGVVAGNNHCWCFDMPPSVTKPTELTEKSCLCQNCLAHAKEVEKLGEPAR